MRLLVFVVAFIRNTSRSKATGHTSSADTSRFSTTLRASASAQPDPYRCCCDVYCDKRGFSEKDLQHFVICLCRNAVTQKSLVSEHAHQFFWRGSQTQRGTQQSRSPSRFGCRAGAESIAWLLPHRVERGSCAFASCWLAPTLSPACACRNLARVMTLARVMLTCSTTSHSLRLLRRPHHHHCPRPKCTTTLSATASWISLKSISQTGTTSTSSTTGALWKSTTGALWKALCAGAIMRLRRRCHLRLRLLHRRHCPQPKCTTSLSATT